MTEDTRQTLIRIRKQKADLIRAMRREGFNRRLIVRVSTTQYGEPQRPGKECLVGYYPLRPIIDSEDKQVGLSCGRGDAESWSQVMLLNGDWDDQEIAFEFNLGYYYHGPGRRFENDPIIGRNGHSTIIYRSGGLDI